MPTPEEIKAQQDKQAADTAKRNLDNDIRRSEIQSENIEGAKTLLSLNNKITEAAQRELEIRFSIYSNLNSTRDLTRKIQKDTNTLARIEGEIAGINDVDVKAHADKIKYIRDQIKAGSTNESLYESLVELTDAANGKEALKLALLREQKIAIGGVIKSSKDALDESKKLDKNFFSIANNVLSTIPGLKGFSQEFKYAAELAREAGGGVKGIAAGLKSINWKQISAAFIIMSANNADKQTTVIAKSMMQTKFEAMQTREQFVGMANASGDAFINTDKLLEANAALGKQMGFNKVFSQDMNQTFVDLTKKIGLSEEAAGGLAKLSIATGRTLKSTEQTIAETTSRISAQNGIQLDGKDILEESGKISGQLLANFKGNPAAIAEAVAQAKVLGTTLEQTKSQASKLLDFESSIGSQLKAQLLTGESLNLERARAYALQGNQVGVAKELTAQGMNFNKFSRLNVIQQNAFAEALGLSSDQLTDQLLKQEVIGKSRSEIVALGGEEAVKRLEALSAQDKFNASVQKLSDLFGNIVGGPLGTILDILSDAVSLVGKLISGIQSILGNTVMKTVLGVGLGIATGGVGLIPALIGGAAGLASGIASNADDMMGYGARTLITPTGTVALNNNDTVIAGTNLFKGNDVTSYPEGALNLGGNNSRIENLLEKLIGVSSNQQFGIDLDGRSVGTGIVRATYRSA